MLSAETLNTYQVTLMIVDYSGYQKTLIRPVIAYYRANIKRSTFAKQGLQTPLQNVTALNCQKLIR